MAKKIKCPVYGKGICKFEKICDGILEISDSHSVHKKLHEIHKIPKSISRMHLEHTMAHTKNLFICKTIWNNSSEAEHLAFGTFDPRRFEQ